MARRPARSRVRRRRDRAARAPIGAALVAFPILMLAAAPVAAALPGQHWLPLCGGDGTHWILLPDGATPPPYAPPSDDRDHGLLCAHATCPAGNRQSGKARLRL